MKRRTPQNLIDLKHEECTNIAKHSKQKKESDDDFDDDYSRALKS